MKSAYFRYQPHIRVFRVASAMGLPDAFVERLSETAGRLGEERGLVGLVAARAESIYVPNVQADPRFMVEDPTVRSAYYTPIAAPDALLGVLALFAGEADGFSAAHRGLADAYAREVGRSWWLHDHVGRCSHPAEESCALHTAVDGLLSTGASSAHASSVGSAQAGATQEGVDLGLLSERERDVVLAMCRGLRLAEIARVLGISHHTARNHLKRVFKKLGVHSQVELLVLLGNPKPGH